ncbi:protein NRT1/ PTR FAMILY 2.8 [Euphorbia lathyris]|uniref:protein NRT1/ PTR FAMILY 2.8 n=1 Tax=Euphorbia lathyris TaxID=212925 RepID=UPI0033142FC8
MDQDTSSEQETPPPPPKTKLGGWRAIAYILVNETFEKVASMSLIANMIVYLRTHYNLGGVFTVNVTTIWSGSSNITSLFGAFIADTFLGKYRTLLFGSISSLLGMLGMTLTVSMPSLTPPKCKDLASNCPQPHKWQLAFLFVSLGFLSIGAGGIRPCNIAFGADQFDTRTPKIRATLEKFFNWWYFAFTIALLIALTVVVWVQTNVSWILGFVIPTLFLVISISIFLIGRHTYIRKKPQGSIFIDMIKVIVASWKKRRLTILPNYDPPLYDPPMDKANLHLKLDPTDRFKFINKAAMIADPDEVDAQGKAKNTWRLCSLQQVEELKCLVAIAPVWVSGISCFIVMDQQSAFGILQAIQMNRQIGSHFEVPPAWMGLTSMIALSTWILIYEISSIHLAKRSTRKPSRLSFHQRIGIGIFMSILCMIVAAIVEKERRGAALKHGTFVSPKSVAWLLPQFVLSGLVEAFAAIAVMEFYTTQMPENMRTIAGAVFFISLSVASYISSLLINIIHVVTKRKGGVPWLGGRDLNRNRLDYWYIIVAGLAVLNLLYFTFVASRFAKNQIHSSTAKNLIEDETDDEERGMEMRNTRTQVE